MKYLILIIGSTFLLSACGSDTKKSGGLLLPKSEHTHTDSEEYNKPSKINFDVNFEDYNFNSQFKNSIADITVLPSMVTITIFRQDELGGRLTLAFQAEDMRKSRPFAGKIEDPNKDNAVSLLFHPDVAQETSILTAYFMDANVAEFKKNKIVINLDAKLATPFSNEINRGDLKTLKGTITIEDPKISVLGGYLDEFTY